MITSIRTPRVVIIFSLTFTLLAGSMAYQGSPAANAAPVVCDASIAISPLTPSFPVNANQLFIPPIMVIGSIDVTASDPCWQQFVVDSDWIVIVSTIVDHNDPPNFDGTINFEIQPNFTSQRRIGHVGVGDEVFTVFQGARFNDVPEDYVFFTEIGLLSAHGITNGCGLDIFCVGAPTTRGQMAVFIVRSLGEFDPPVPAMQTFLDVPPTHPFFPFIERLAALGITVGCAPGLFCPDEHVPRDQMAAFIIRALGEFNPPTPGSQRFLDVLPSNQFYNFIDRLAALGITSGCSQSPPLYCPDDEIPRQETAAFLVRAFNF